MKKILFILSLAVALSPDALRAQELPRPSMAQETEPRTLPTDYNMKVGPVLLNFNSSLEADYVDNVALSNTGAQSDFELTPEVGVGFSWPITETNTLSLGTSLGYTAYMIHPQYDTGNLLVSPNSRLAFDVYTGNFKFDFHDVFSFQQDPVNEAAFSNIVNFGRFENDAGVSVLWDLNRVVLNLNYDHINFISTQLQTVNGNNLPDPDLLDYSADQVSAAADVHMSSTLSGGVEGVVSQRTYDNYTGDYDTWSVGPFMKVQVTQHIKVEASGGFENVDSPNNFAGPGQILPSNVIQPGSSGGSTDSYYFDVTVDHELNKYYLQRFSIGHDVVLGILGEQDDTSYVNYTSSWHVNRDLNLALNLSYQDVSEVGGLVNVSSYNYLSAGVQANFPVTRSLSGALFYQLSDKFATQSDQSYQQNKVGLLLTYHY
ncbi:MAG: hypothetical protein LV481_06070 [Methylacidiphilales bacterium]|nr:hypothetical protein [Candidatus Methylacidiphilales bacterium]